MSKALVGNWKCVSNENFDDFLKELGVGFMQRKVASGLKPNLSIEQQGDVWNIVSETSVKTIKTSFELNKEFDEESQDGRKVKSITTLDGDKMVHTQRLNGSVVCTVTRELHGNDEQVVSFKAGDVTAKRVFKRA